MSQEVVFSRRDYLRGLAVAAIGTPVVAGATTFRPSRARPSRRSLRVSETAGLRRYGYPVHVALPPDEGPYRLIRDGRPVPAQFRCVEAGPDGGPGLSLDFIASPGPFESQDYTVESGTAVEPGPEPTRGLSVDRVDGVFRIDNGSVLRVEIADDLRGFLRSFGNAGLQFLDDRPGGLLVKARGGQVLRLGGPDGSGAMAKAVIERQGPLAVALAFDVPLEIDGKSVPSRIRMTVPSSKSWVETAWTFDDPDGLVVGAALELGLAIEGSPTLVDFGARSTVYGTLDCDATMSLEAAPDAEGRHSWSVVRGASGRGEPVALSGRGVDEPAEGWAHVMDHGRCTAAAVDGFGRHDEDRIEIHADGRLILARTFAVREGQPEARPKTWRTWLHFVTMPVQVGAATSPQAMQAPLEVRVDDAG
jgi:hypothetical protein